MKKLCSILILSTLTLSFGVQVYAACPCDASQNIANADKKSDCREVYDTEDYYIIVKGNIIKIAFECKFQSECTNEGDCVYFYLPKDIYDTCGNIILPIGTKFQGYVRGITPQKKFNKNARVYININNVILPDGTEIDIKAKPFNKDFSLVENGWMTAGKLAASTVGLGAIGTGAGVGLAFIPRPHKIAIGAGTGVAVGCFIGLVTGLVTPGLKYHAKQGEEIKVILCDDLYVPKCSVSEY